MEIGDYIRTKKGKIGKIINIDINNNAYYLNCMSCVSLENIVKQSESIIDLIEVGDILELKEDNNICYLGLKQDTTTIDYNDLKEDIKNNKVELLSILTHEQYSTNCYKVGG